VAARPRTVRELAQPDVLCLVLGRRLWVRGLTRGGRAVAPVLNALGPLIRRRRRALEVLGALGLSFRFVEPDALDLAIRRLVVRLLRKRGAGRGEARLCGAAAGAQRVLRDAAEKAEEE